MIVVSEELRDMNCRHSCSSTSTSCSTGNNLTIHQEVVHEHDYCVFAFYQFFDKTAIVNESVNDDISNTEEDDVSIRQRIEREWRDEMESVLRSYHTYGMIRISIQEGMNGTICFPTQHLDSIRSFLEKQQHSQQQQKYDTETTQSSSSSLSSPFKIRISYYTTPPFHRLSIRIKKEIVTMGPIPQHWISDMENNDQVLLVVGDDGHEKSTTATTQTTCYVRPYSRPARDIHRSTGTGSTTIPIYPTTTGLYVPPGREWDELLYDPQCLVIDTRNIYEIQMGTFVNAISPQIHEFTDFPTWLHDTLQSPPRQPQPQFNKIAMFCTGGIRCEKATVLCIQMLHKSSSASRNDDTIEIPTVYHLEGGILAYLENNHPQSSDGIESTATKSDTSVSDQSSQNNVKENETTLRIPQYGNNFLGECFVFDQRVAVTYGLQPTQQYISCHACRRPVHVDLTINHPKYQKGICCPSCYNDDEVIDHGSSSSTIDNNKKQQRYMERQKQMDLATQTISLKPHLYDSKYIQ